MPERPNQQGGIGVVSDALSWRRRLQPLMVKEVFTREALVITGATSLSGRRVGRVLERVATERKALDEIVLESGPELAGKGLERWASECGVWLRVIESGKPVHNPFVERLQGRLRMVQILARGHDLEFHIPPICLLR